MEKRNIGCDAKTIEMAGKDAPAQVLATNIERTQKLVSRSFAIRSIVQKR